MRALDMQGIPSTSKGNAEISLLAGRIETCRKRHAEIVRKGTTDPFWPDGVCANITRANIAYYLQLIQNICAQCHVQYPPVGVSPILPKRVPINFMAKHSKAAQFYFAG